jgi:serine/threonine protein kinase/tetratricopeptide (TPR) repeat protein
VDFDGTDRFEVIARLGEGAMGVVYRAIDRERNETVAIKTLRNLDGDRLLRFKNEFRSIQSLQHPNLVSLGELIETGGHWFFTMELVEGIDFFSHVRPRWVRPSADDYPADLESDPAHDRPLPRARFDGERLRSSLAQLVRGVATLHRAGFVHRDIKPSNILVSRDGRVVLLDFGFVAAANERSSDRVIGTIAYMSPEQAAAMPVGPESDWYSVGIVLYEALTGRPPFDGMPLEVLMAKQFREPIRPSEILRDVPEDLEKLCIDLLRTSPSERPGEREILRRLGAEPALPDSINSSINLPHHLFIGRTAELAVLRDAFERCRRGGTVAVFIQGESGIGKTALVRAFTDELASRAGAPLVLRSTCYERESVPFKAFDGVADSLSDHLVDLQAGEVEALIPNHISPVADVFPVLRRSEVIGRSLRPPADEIEPAEVRARVFSGLRELFTRLAERRPVVIVIDDFQWADADSLALLRELIRPPDPPAVLLVTTVRDGAETPAPLASPAQAIGAENGVELRLEGLPDAEARDMVRRLAFLLAPSLASAVDSIAEESRGHPLYIDEMVRYGALEGIEPGGAPHLEDVLWSRIGTLDPPVREIVELVAVASGPLDKGMVSAILRQQFSDFVRRVGQLRLAKLVQTTGVRKRDRIELFHDRVRRAVLAHLGPAQRRTYHERLALAFEGSLRAAPELLAIHWGGAGDQGKAFHYTRRAAREAERALAFDRAARLYRRCLDLLPADSRDGTAIRTRLGDALVNAGRGAEAANAYLAAAQEAREGVVELLAKAAGQLLRSGHVDSSLEVLRRALEGLDLTLPETPRGALVSLLRQRALIRMHGLGFKTRREGEVSERELARVDISWALAVGFGLIDVIRGAEFQAKHLRLALAAGEPGRVARALSVEFGYRTLPGTRSGRSAARVLAKTQELTTRLGQPPNLVGLNTLMAGISGICLGHWRAAEENCRRAEEILRDQCSGVAWELASARIMGLWALWYLGDVKEIARRLPRILRAAQQRGDLYAFTTCRTYFTPMAHLARDEAEDALEQGERALRRWSQRGFHFQHYFHLFASTQVLLYAGRFEAAHQRVAAEWPALRSSLLLSVQQNRVEALHFRARAELALGCASGDGKLVGQALARARAIERARTPWGDGLALLIRAGADRASGRTDRAVHRLGQAGGALDRAGMQLYAAAARRGLAALTGDGTLARQTEATLTSLGVTNPARMAAMLAPGL